MNNANGQPFGGKKLLIPLAAVAVVILIAVIISTVISGMPINMIANALEKSVDKAQDGELADTLADALEGGSIEVSGKLGSMLGDVGMADVDGEFSLKLYMDMKKSAVAAIASAGIGGAEALDFSAFITDKSAVVSSDALLGNKAYGVDLKNFASELEGSVFGGDGKYAIDIPEDVLDSLTKTGDQLLSLDKKGEKAGKAIWGAILKAVADNMELSKSKGALTFVDKEVKTTDITISADGKQLTDAIEDVLKAVKKDDDIRAFIKDYTAIMGENLDTDADDIYDAIDEALDNIDKLEESLEDVDLTVIVSIHSGQIVGVDVTLKDDRTKLFDASFICGPTWDKITEAKLTVKSPVSYTATYTVEENTRENYSAKFTLKQSGEKLGELNVEWDKSEGGFRVRVKDADMTLAGSLKVTGKSTTLTLSYLMTGGVKQELGDITLTLTKNDKMPSVPSYENVLKLSEEDVDELANTFAEAFNGIMTEIGGILPTPGFDEEPGFDDSGFGGEDFPF